MTLKLGDLELAFDYVSAGYGFDHSAYLDKESGQIYYDSDASEDVLPDDLFENEKYVEIPDKREFDLGKPLVMEFIQIYSPSDSKTVYSIFQSKGAYSKYKALIDERGLLEKWYEFEQEALNGAMVQWCKDNAIKFSI